MRVTWAGNRPTDPTIIRRPALPPYPHPPTLTLMFKLIIIFFCLFHKSFVYLTACRHGTLRPHFYLSGTCPCLSVVDSRHLEICVESYEHLAKAVENPSTRYVPPRSVGATNPGHDQQNRKLEHGGRESASRRTSEGVDVQADECAYVSNVRNRFRVAKD